MAAIHSSLQLTPADPEVGLHTTDKQYNRHSLSLAAIEEGEILEKLLSLDKMRQAAIVVSIHALKPFTWSNA